jgi:glycosyltransferase involved in cell wall biosynthesis
MNFPVLNNQTSLGLTIPMFNEEGAAEQVLQQTMYVLRKANIPFQLAVVNNGSTDATGMIIDKLSIQHSEIIPVHFTTNQGYGGGILAGMRTLEPQNLDCIGWMWGDGQVLPDVLPKLVQACHEGNHLAKAQRTKREDGWLRKVISKGYAIAMKSTALNVEDINGCPKIFQLPIWETLQIESRDWFLDAEVILEMQANKLCIHQEPVTMQPRQYNKSKVNVRTVLEFGVNILKWKLHHI